MNKAEIKAFAMQVRKKLISAVMEKAKMYGFSSDTTAFSLSLVHLQKADYVAQLQKQLQKTDLSSFVESIACLWFNRLVAVWFMEVNDYLPGEKIFSRFLHGQFDEQTEQAYTMEEEQELQYLQQCGYTKEQACAQVVFLRICRQLGRYFPQLFSVCEQPCELLLPIFHQESVVYDFLLLPKEVCHLESGGKVEIIGWLYQYYHTESKEETFALLRKGKKITKERIPSATQLFTPDWIVRYMIENSVGRLWLQEHPNEVLEKKWTYYLQPVNRIRQKKRQERLRPQDLTIVDPCMGSGHILAYAFDVLVDIYCSEGYTPEQAAREIITHNLYGLEIDDSVYMLSYFAVMMKARFYDAEIFHTDYQLHLCSIQESNEIPRDIHQQLGQVFPILNRDEIRAIDLVVDLFYDAKTYGSCLQAVEGVTSNFFEQAFHKLNSLQKENIHWNIEQWNMINRWFPLLKTLLQQMVLLTKTYLVTVTNPPYMGKKSLNQQLSTFLEAHYPTGKSELYAAFIQRCEAFTKLGGCFSMVTVHTWMFLTSFQKLRQEILRHYRILSLIHTGAATFEELNAFNVLAATFVIQKAAPNGERTRFIRLTDYLSSQEKIKHYAEFQHHYTVNQSMFHSVPGTPFIYWASKKAIEAFAKGTPLYQLAMPRVGMQTGNNKRFVRYWYEIDFTKFCNHAQTLSEAFASGAKWFPYHKGGNFRKWFGMNEYVVDWENGGQELRLYKGAVLRNETYYFQSGITWSLFGFENFAVRYKTAGFLFDVSGSSMFPQEDKLGEILGFLCSKVAFYFLSLLAPTVNFQAGNVGDLPILPVGTYGKTVNRLVKENCAISKEDWDCFETSWDFRRHPLIEIQLQRKYDSIEKCYQLWEEQAKNRYLRLKQNEEKMNRIFITLYGLEDSVTPEVIPRDIAIRRADYSRDIKLFLSYLVGCLFGRYHPYENGIWYAGGTWNHQHENGIVVTENILVLRENKTVTAQPDVTDRVVDLVAKLYGEAQLQNNLLFIAKALDEHCTDAIETIRNYFWRYFYKEHIRLYQKHPIYWQLDSGNQSGFRALFYVHRASAKGFGTILEQYLQPQLKQLEARVNTCSQQKIPKRQQEKLQKSWEALYHYERAYRASIPQLSCMELDDGVKQNYEKFQHISIIKDNGETAVISLFSHM